MNRFTNSLPRQINRLNRNTIFVILAIAAALAYFFFFHKPAAEQMSPVNYDAYDIDNPDVFGTREVPRWENVSVRDEYYGTPGQTHVCKCGFASKRMIDAYGSDNHSLGHMCRPCNGQTEPEQLGNWWANPDQCTESDSVGVNVRPSCSRCH